MRRSRLSRTRSVSYRFSAILMFVIVAVALVGAGYLLGRFVLSSILSRYWGAPASAPTGQKGGSSDTVTVTLGFEEKTAYSVQVGAFSNRENATKLAEACISRGVPAYVMAPDPLHRVFCGVLPSRESAEKMAAELFPKLAGSVLPAGEKMYVGSFQIPAVKLTVSVDRNYASLLEEAFKKSGAAVDALLRFWDARYGKASPPDLKAAYRDVQSAVSNLKSATPPNSTRELHSACLSLLESLSRALSAADALYGGDVARGPEAMLETLKVTDALVALARRSG